MSDSPYRERIRDKALETNIALWNALLTANSVLVAAGAILVVLSPHASRWLWSCFFLACGVSLGLLVMNFLTARNLFVHLGRVMDGLVTFSSEAEQKADIARAERLRIWQARRENLAVTLLFVELLLVVASVWLQEHPGAA